MTSEPAMGSGSSELGQARVTPLGGDLGWSLRALSLHFQAMGEDAVADIPGGARGYLVLIAVSESDAPSQLTLATQLTIDKTQMTTLLDRLQAEGLVERRPDPADRRARLIGITSRGRRRLEQARSLLATVEDQLLSPLPTDERVAFRRMMSQIAMGLTDPAAEAR